MYMNSLQEATSTSTSQLTAMLQPYIDVVKEKVKEPILQDPNQDKALKGKGTYYRAKIIGWNTGNAETLSNSRLRRWPCLA